MKVEFSRSLSGFNRQEVIDYIRKLTNEKHRAETDALESLNKLNDAEYCMETLKNELTEEINKRDDEIAALSSDISDKDALIAQLRDEIAALTEKLNAADDEKRNKLNPALIKAGEAEAELRMMASELADISDRVKKAHTDISDAVVTIEDYARE